MPPNDHQSFKHIKYVLLVGIGGGVPVTQEQSHIRLGDVVIGTPSGGMCGVLQYDRGRAQDGQIHWKGGLTAPPTVLLNAANELDMRRDATPVT